MKKTNKQTGGWQNQRGEKIIYSHGKFPDGD